MVNSHLYLESNSLKHLVPAVGVDGTQSAPSILFSCTVQGSPYAAGLWRVISAINITPIIVKEDPIKLPAAA